MDKQKQRDELAVTMCTDKLGCKKCTEGRSGYICAYKIVADIAINAGYRKIPEGAVVLTKEELQAHDKELAEKFAERLKDEYLPSVSSYFLEDDPNQFELESELCDLTDEICKEFTGGAVI